MKAAFEATLELVGPELRDALKDRLAVELYRVRERSIAALEAGDIEDGEFEAADEDTA